MQQRETEATHATYPNDHTHMYIRTYARTIRSVCIVCTYVRTYILGTLCMYACDVTTIIYTYVCTWTFYTCEQAFSIGNNVCSVRTYHPRVYTQTYRTIRSCTCMDGRRGNQPSLQIKHFSHVLGLVIFTSYTPLWKHKQALFPKRLHKGLFNDYIICMYVCTYVIDTVVKPPTGTIPWIQTRIGYLLKK